MLCRGLFCKESCFTQIFFCEYLRYIAAVGAINIVLCFVIVFR